MTNILTQEKNLNKSIQSIQGFESKKFYKNYEWMFLISDGDLLLRIMINNKIISEELIIYHTCENCSEQLAHYSYDFLNYDREYCDKCFTKTSSKSCRWKIYKGHSIQGAFEEKVAEWLNDKNINWISHEEIEPIPYIDEEGNKRLYNPDFLNLDSKTIYEPHSSYYWNEKFEYKIEQCRKNGYKIVAFDEDTFRRKINGQKEK